MEKEDVDTNATVELFMVITGISTIAFGVGFNLPFIVAPSILYAVRETRYFSHTGGFHPDRFFYRGAECY